MIAATPAASGRAVGAWMPSTGCESCPGLRSSACAREPACTAAISGAAIGIGESCQFQNRVRSIFSAALKRPSTASANTPPDGSGMISLLGVGRSRPRRFEPRLPRLLLLGPSRILGIGARRDVHLEDQE